MRSDFRARCQSRNLQIRLTAMENREVREEKLDEEGCTDMLLLAKRGIPNMESGRASGKMAEGSCEQQASSYKIMKGWGALVAKDKVVVFLLSLCNMGNLYTGFLSWKCHCVSLDLASQSGWEHPARGRAELWHAQPKDLLLSRVVASVVRPAVQPGITCVQLQDWWADKWQFYKERWEPYKEAPLQPTSKESSRRSWAEGRGRPEPEWWEQWCH